MKVMAFDLSTVCIGIVAFELRNNEILRGVSVPVMPPKFDPQTLGYKRSKAKIQTPKGKPINAYIRPGETVLSEAEKKRRDREVRGAKDIFVLQSIGDEIKTRIWQIEPDLVLVEKNNIFNGQLTTVLLAKLMGVLVGVTGAMGIELKEYSVTSARSIFNMAKLTKEFAAGKTVDELQSIPDKAKRALREEMTRLYGQYGVRFLTDDESDACVIFHYWYLQTQQH